MSVRSAKRLSSRKKKSLKENAQTEVLRKLGLEAHLTSPLDPASMLDISTWTMENPVPMGLRDLPKAFLQRLWLLRPDARSPCYKPPNDVSINADKSPVEMNNGFENESQNAINHLDLVTAVFMSSDSFLQQEMSVRMMQCQFAVPLILPSIDPEEPSRFLLWPLRGLMSQWTPHFLNQNNEVQEGDLASTYMPMVSCVKLGHCCVSKSQVLNHIVSGQNSCNETFLQRGMDGGQLPRRLANGLVEIGWYLPTGDTATDIFPVPMIISNLRGDASAHEKCLTFLCQASSAVVVFCGNLREKEKQLLAYCKNMANNLILIDVSDTERNENRVVGFVDPNLEEDIGLPERSVIQGKALSAEELANTLCNTVKDLLPHNLKPVTLEAASTLALELGLHVDEGVVCKTAMATVEEVLKGLEMGSAQFKEKQLPLQGPKWSRLAEIEKEERKQREEGKEIDPQQQKEKKDILIELSSYKMTPSMKIFTDALFTTDKVERTYFLSWMKLRLQMLQTPKKNSSQDWFTNLQTEEKDVPEQSDELKNGTNDNMEDNESFYTDSFEEDKSEEQSVNADQVSDQLTEQDVEHVLCKCTGEDGDSRSQQINLEPTSAEDRNSLSQQVNLEPTSGEDRNTLSQQVNLEQKSGEDGDSLSQQVNPEPTSAENGDTLSQQVNPESTFGEDRESQPQHINLESTSGDDGDSLSKQVNPEPTFGEDGDSLPQQIHLESTSGEDRDSLPQQVNPEPTSDPVTEHVMSNGTDIQSEETLENEEQISAPVLDNQNLPLGLEHFLREMGLIFELTHISPGSGSHNVLRLPSLAADLILYGIPLELLDGDASNIPMRWLGCVFAELNRRLPHWQCRTRVLTNLGVHHAKNAEVLSALFGVKFPEGRKKSTRGVYMVVLHLPDTLKMEMGFDYLLLVDVEGLCSVSQDSKINTYIHDNEMATVATGLSDVLLHNISSRASSEFETDLAVIVNALLRIKECGTFPSCHLLVQDEGLNCSLQASQLRRVSEILQTEIKDREPDSADKQCTKTTSCVTCVKGPWSNVSISEPVGLQYSTAVLKLKKNLFEALKECTAKSEATVLSVFMMRLSAVWDTVTAASFSIGLRNTEIALTFALLCTELSQWEDSFLGHMEKWLMGPKQKIFATKARAVDSAIQNELLSALRDQARNEVKSEVDKLRSKVEAYVMKDELSKVRTEKFKPILMNNLDDLQQRTTVEMIQKLESINESHCYSTQLESFETLLEKERESKLQSLLEKSKSNKVLPQDEELEDEFEGVWNKMLSNFDFRPSETEDISVRVIEILRQNLLNHGLQKHMKKIEDIGQNQTSSFQVYDEHFGYRSRLKHMFEDNNRLQRVKAQQVATDAIEACNQFVADKCSLPADFSDSYITEMLEKIEKILKGTHMEIRSAFEVDLKVHICNSACQEFQKLHDRYAKDRDLLTCITANKTTYLSQFIYQFRKRDQCQRIAQTFMSMVIKPTILDYIYRPLGMRIVEGIQVKEEKYESPRAFHNSLLEQLIKEEDFEGFLQYLHSYDSFRLKKIEETVVTHLSESTNLNKWRQQRLGEIVGKIAAAVSQTAEGTSGVLSDTKPLLKIMCLTLERDGSVNVTKAPLDGPLLSITTEWDRFITCIMELLAALRLELAQEFSHNVDITTSSLSCLPVQPQSTLFNRVRGCNKQCPQCKAPCEEEETGHEVHRILLHRPKSVLPTDSCTASCISDPESKMEGNPDQDKDTENASEACKDIQSPNPCWDGCPEDTNGQPPNAFWRYVLARFDEKFAKEYGRQSARIPQEWKVISMEEALDSLKEALSLRSAE